MTRRRRRRGIQTHKTHIIGVGIRIGTRAVQRCAVCGMQLVNHTGPDAGVSPYSPAIKTTPEGIARDGIVIEYRDGLWHQVARNPKTDLYPAPTCLDSLV